MFRKFLIISLIILIVRPVYSQSYSQERFELTLYDIGVGAVVGGAGRLLNKKPDEKGINAILRGMGIGAAGGGLVALGESLTHQIVKNQAIGYGWLARLTNVAGSSIVQNAFNNREWWANWNLNALGFHLEYNTIQ